MKAVIYARFSSTGQREESIVPFCQGSKLSFFYTPNPFAHPEKYRIPLMLSAARNFFAVLCIICEQLCGEY